MYTYVLLSRNLILQCHQLTGLLDVGYIEKIADQEMVVFRRNITVGIGCACEPVHISRRIHHPEEISRLK